MRKLSSRNKEDVAVEQVVDVAAVCNMRRIVIEVMQPPNFVKNEVYLFISSRVLLL
jgi:hypothetical protein